VTSSRLKRFTVPVEQQTEWESARLWRAVGEAIVQEDQLAATEEKTLLEEAQRGAVRERQAAGADWQTKLFLHEGMALNPDGTESEAPQYSYRHADLRPWDPRNDLLQYEKDYMVCTRTRHKTPMMRTQSIVSVLAQEPLLPVGGRRDRKKERVELQPAGGLLGLEAAIQPLLQEQRAMSDRIGKLNHTIEVCLYQQKERDSHSNLNRDLVLLVILVVMIQVGRYTSCPRSRSCSPSPFPPPPGGAQLGAH
jgi:hypothetical protein